MDSGWDYVDVRSEGEFGQGHPRGAFNLPLMHVDESGQRRANPDFAQVALANFATDKKLVVGCATVRRASAAAKALGELGYQHVCVMSGGWEGEEDSLGRTTVEGWASRQLPSSNQPESGRSYNELKQRAEGVS